MRPERDEGTEGEPGFGSRSPHLGKNDIGKNLSIGGAGQPDGTLVLVAGLLAGKVYAGIFENLVKSATV